jgi:hypothetical protein
MRRGVLLTLLVIGVAAWEFASLRAGVGRAGRFPPESTTVAPLVTAGSLAAVCALILFGVWLKRRTEQNDRRLPYGITIYRRRR